MTYTLEPQTRSKEGLSPTNAWQNPWKQNKMVRPHSLWSRTVRQARVQHVNWISLTTSILQRLLASKRVDFRPFLYCCWPFTQHNKIYAVRLPVVSTRVHVMCRSFHTNRVWTRQKIFANLYSLSVWRPVHTYSECDFRHQITASDQLFAEGTWKSWTYFKLSEMSSGICCDVKVPSLSHLHEIRTGLYTA